MTDVKAVVLQMQTHPTRKELLSIRTLGLLASCAIPGKFPARSQTVHPHQPNHHFSLPFSAVSYLSQAPGQGPTLH